MSAVGRTQQQQEKRRGFAGRGPKGYQRSDERIEDEINDRLTRHPDIDASDIQVTVRSGVATLTGEVEDRRAKRLAEDIVEDTHGVREVTNQLRVRGRQEQQSQPTQGAASQQTRGLTDREVGRPAEREGAPGTAAASGTTGSTGTASPAPGTGSAPETRRGGTRGSSTRSEG